MLPTRATAARYVRGEDGVLRPHSVQVLTVEEGAVARITTFLDGAAPALWVSAGVAAAGAAVSVFAPSRRSARGGCHPTSASL